MARAVHSNNASNPNKPVVFGPGFKTKKQLRQELRESQRVYDQTVGRVFGYGRVSTDEQELSLAGQEAEVVAYHAWRFRTSGEDYVGWFVDPDTSGSIPFEERDAGGAIYKALLPKDHVVVAKFDRAFRSLLDAARCMDRWEKMGITIHLVDYRIDTGTAAGRLMLQFLAMFAEFERKQISERTKAALRQRKALGFGTVKTRPDLGFSMRKQATGKFNKCGRPTYKRTEYPNEYELRLMRRMYLMHEGGETFQRIAAKVAEAGMKKRMGGTRWSIADVFNWIKAYKKLIGTDKLPAEYAPSAALELTAAECSHPLLWCDAAAVNPTGSGRELLYLSAAGPQTSIKALRAVLHLQKASFSLHFTTPPLSRDDDPFDQFFNFYKGMHGFQVYTHNLGCATWHLVAISLMPGFMPVMDDESLWQQLNGVKFTTPVLRPWTGWLGKQLMETKGLQKAKGWGCQCGFLTADTSELDRLVTKGLKAGTLRID